MKKLMENILNQVTDLNAEADLILSTSKSLKLSAQGEALSEYKVSSSQILGVRLIKDYKVGISYTESLDKESLALMVNQAWRMLKLMKRIPARKFWISPVTLMTSSLTKREKSILLRKLSKS